jgi:putative lipoic acid-binding regulatory protein
MKQARLEFPLHWEYKIITQHTDAALEEIRAVLRQRGFTEIPTVGTVSRNGTYVTRTVALRLESREQMDELTAALGRCSGVKYLL